MGEPVRKRGASDAAHEALAGAPQGEPLTEDERARVEAIRRRPTHEGIPHEQLLAELRERQRRGG